MDTHCSYKQKQVDLEPKYHQEQRTIQISELDMKIDYLTNIITQLQQEIKIEIKGKEDLAWIYEQVMQSNVDTLTQTLEGSKKMTLKNKTLKDVTLLK